MSVEQIVMLTLDAAVVLTVLFCMYVKRKPCEHCHGSNIEFVYGGHGNVLEYPCSYCEV